jgi:hypothetical protein
MMSLCDGNTSPSESDPARSALFKHLVHQFRNRQLFSLRLVIISNNNPESLSKDSIDRLQDKLLMSTHLELWNLWMLTFAEFAELRFQLQIYGSNAQVTHCSLDPWRPQIQSHLLQLLVVSEWFIIVGGSLGGTIWWINLVIWLLNNVIDLFLLSGMSVHWW